jgi:hypothetical protein
MRGRCSAFSSLIPTCVAAATYYVSPDGNDTNSGAIDAAFSNIIRAVSLVGPGDTFIYIKCSGNIIVYCSFHHKRDSGLEIGLGDSDTDNTNRVFSNQVYNGESRLGPLQFVAQWLVLIDAVSMTDTGPLSLHVGGPDHMDGNFHQSVNYWHVGVCRLSGHKLDAVVLPGR